MTTPTPAGRGPTIEDVTSRAAIVLGLAEVLPSDNFLELGGSSLSAVDLVARLEEGFGVTCDIDLLFDTFDFEQFHTELVRAAAGGTPTSLDTPTPTDAWLTTGPLASSAEPASGVPGERPRQYESASWFGSGEGP